MTTRYKCKDCGSNNIVFDASAEWNEELQWFEVRNIFDDHQCDECGSANIDQIEEAA